MKTGSRSAVALSAKRSLAIVGLIGLVAVGAAIRPVAGQAEKPDGSMWSSFSDEMKLGYAVGFLQGVHFGEEMIVVGFGSVGSDASTLLRSQKLYSTYLKGHFSELSAGQIIDGLNVFYRDFRNRNIEMPKAAWVVTHEVVGTPKLEVEATIEALRRGTMKEPSHK